MAEKIDVLRSTLTEMLRIAPNSDEATIRKAMREAIAANEATIAAQHRQAATSAEEQRLQAEDRRLVNAAHNDGRILNREDWAQHLAADRVANRALLASLARGLRPDEQLVVDEELEASHRAVLRRLGIQSPPSAKSSAPRTVAAASNFDAVARERAVLDDLGLPIAQVPPPVRISRGSDPSDWTERQRQDWALRQLGPQFRPGTKAPPAQDVWYQPSPNDHSEYVEGEGWRPNANYQPRSSSG